MGISVPVTRLSLIWRFVSSRRSYAASLGEIAVAFDFGPLVDAPRHLAGTRLKEDLLVYPLYILYGNGETFLSYTSLTYAYGRLSRNTRAVISA